MHCVQSVPTTIGSLLHAPLLAQYKNSKGDFIHRQWTTTRCNASFMFRMNFFSRFFDESLVNLRDHLGQDFHLLHFTIAHDYVSENCIIANFEKLSIFNFLRTNVLCVCVCVVKQNLRVRAHKNLLTTLTIFLINHRFFVMHFLCAYFSAVSESD